MGVILVYSQLEAHPGCGTVHSNFQGGPEEGEEEEGRYGGAVVHSQPSSEPRLLLVILQAPVLCQLNLGMAKAQLAQQNQHGNEQACMPLSLDLAHFLV